MATVIRTKLSPILAAVRDRLITRLRFNPARVIVSLRPVTEAENQAEQYVLIRPAAQAMNEPIINGAGRIDARTTRRIGIYLRTRLLTDEPYDDERWLTDASFGHLDQEHVIIDALEMFLPTDKDENALLYEPIRLRPSPQPEKDPIPDGWGQSGLEFDASYELDLDQADQ